MVSPTQLCWRYHSLPLSQWDDLVLHLQLSPGDELESDRYLIQVEGLSSTNSTPPASVSQPPSQVISQPASVRPASTHSVTRLPAAMGATAAGPGRRVGLKRTAGRAVSGIDWTINASPPGQNGRYLADNIFRCIFVNKMFRILMKISLNFVPRGLIENIPALV